MLNVKLKVNIIMLIGSPPSKVISNEGLIYC